MLFGMRHLAGAAAFVLIPWVARAQDIYLARLTPDGGLNVKVETPVNITNRAGYDNQPSFTPDGRAILYTSTREDQQADIYRYDLATKAITRLTKTAPESEYSAIVMPRGDRFSVIRVEKDSTQRIWSFDLNGDDPRLEVPNIKPVGYHAWIGADRVAMFVLGSPNTLQIADRRASRGDTVTTNIGRSLMHVPAGGEGLFSFVKRDSVGSAFSLYWGQEDASHTKPIMRSLGALPAGSEYVAWVGFMVAITGQGSKLLRLMPQNAAGSQWIEIADFTAAGLTRISRLAISRDGQWIAIVAEPRP
jgi:dipeptidyl aminopeptidase/acylaminoacyl peptidase